MKLEHVAIWTENLESMRNFYCTFLGGVSNSKYTNPTKQFSSYFIEFESGARLELMHRPDMVNHHLDPGIIKKGLAHLAFYTDTMAQVDQMAQLLRDAGLPILNGPRKTGDGYYEFEFLDPEQNRIEIGTPFRS